MHDCHAAGITFHTRNKFLDIDRSRGYDPCMTDPTTLTDDALRDAWNAAMLARFALLRRASSSTRTRERLAALAPTLAALRAEWIRRELKG